MKLDSLDILFSKYIRLRAIQRVGGCERCLTLKNDSQKDDGSIFPAYKKLQCSHFIGRSNHQTRWDEDDACGLCGACHIYLGSHPLEHVEFFKERLGDKLDLLRARSREIGKVDKSGLVLYYQDKIRQLDDE